MNADVWVLSRQRGKDTLQLSEMPMRWLAVERIAGWMLRPRLTDWLAQRLFAAADKRRVDVLRMPLTPSQVRDIDPDWADIWETLEVDEGEEIRR